MEDSNVGKDGYAKEEAQIQSKGEKGTILKKHGIDAIIRLLNKKGYRSWEALEVRKEIERSKKTYADLIRDQDKMPGQNKLAEAVVKYYLFQLDELKSELPYDAMGGGFIVPLLIMQEFQKETIIENIMSFLGNPDNFNKEGLYWEIQRFITVYLDPRGAALYIDLLEKVN